MGWTTDVDVLHDEWNEQSVEGDEPRDTENIRNVEDTSYRDCREVSDPWGIKSDDWSCWGQCSFFMSDDDNCKKVTIERYDYEERDVVVDRHCVQPRFMSENKPNHGARDDDCIAEDQLRPGQYLDPNPVEHFWLTVAASYDADQSDAVRIETALQTVEVNEDTFYNLNPHGQATVHLNPETGTVTSVEAL